MKNANLFIYGMFFIFLITNCSGSKSDSGSPDPTSAVCIWDKVSLKDAPGDAGKWIASINLGERCTYLSDSKEDNSGKRPITYIKIKLQDGTSGWVQGDFVITGSKPAAVVTESEIYSRPDLLTKTGKTYSPMDIVAMKSEQNGWIEITGKRKNGKWIESGWIKPTDVSYEDVDIAVANFGSKAILISDKQKRNEAIKVILDNSSYSSSVFVSLLKDLSPEQQLENKPSEPTTKDTLHNK